jgi:hypothetical protein
VTGDLDSLLPTHNGGAHVSHIQFWFKQACVPTGPNGE